MSLEFSKYHGLGNDFILIDNRHQAEPLLGAAEAVQLCERHYGIGADGVIFLLPGIENTDYSMRIFNSDGSEPEMCGNGIRCLARFVAHLEGTTAASSYRIATKGGIMSPQLEEQRVTVDMGLPQLIAQEIPTTLAPAKEQVVERSLAVAGKTWSVTCVGMGNPHCVTFVDNIQLPLETLGPQFEHHDVFPERTNVEFVQIVKRNFLKMRVWERGAGATLACGTGACACVVAAVLTNRCDRLCTVELPGGCLEIEWAENGRVYMTGPAQRVFTGRLD